MFLRIYLLIFCTGGCMACMTNRLCKEFDKVANEVSNDIVAYCPLLSQTVACFAGEGCPDSILDPLYAKYYSTCGLTESDVTTCASKTAGCSGLKKSAEDSLPSDLKSYCSTMSSYKDCIDAVVPSQCNDPKVTTFDVFGKDYGKYEITCQNTTFIECQDKMRTASCSFYVKTASEALLNRDFGSLCTSLTNYKSCTDNVFLQCDQTLSKAVFLDGYDSQLQHYCSDEARECQGWVTTNCSSLLDSGSLCGQKAEYLECVTRTMKDCNASVEESSVIGRFRVNFIFQCGPEGTKECPAIPTCMTQLQEENQKTSSTPNILEECGKTGLILSCMETEFTKCGRSSPRPYTYKDVSQLYVKSCQTMANETDLLDCDAMNVCMSNLPLSTDPVEIAKLYYDPEFWCNLLKMAIECGSQLTRECGASLSTMSSLLSDTEALCYTAGPTASDRQTSQAGPTASDRQTSQAGPTASDRQTSQAGPTASDRQTSQAGPTASDRQTSQAGPTASDGQTSQAAPTPLGPNEQTTGPVSEGFKTGAGTLSYLSLLAVILIYRHR